MRRPLSAALVALLAAASLQAQKQSAGPGRIVGETAAGFLGAPLGFALGYVVGSRFQPHGQSNPGVALGLAGALVGPAAGVNIVGNGGPSRGNFAAAVGGAALGYGAIYFVLPLANKINPTKAKIAAILGAFTLPAIGATIAYNATRK